MIPKIPAIDNPSKYYDFEISKEKLNATLEKVLKKVDYAMSVFGVNTPEDYSVNNVYAIVENNKNWGSGFWPGIYWHAYELTGNEKYKERGLQLVPSFHKRIVEKLGVAHHDMGFLYTPSCVSAYKLCGNEQAKEAAILAADNLISRYHEKAKFIQAWGKMGSATEGRLIIDCLLNIPLLYWASEVTGDKKYEEIAYNHFNTAVNVVCREDASTFHTYFFDTEAGVPLRGATVQGAFDDSAWARGQGWGVYGPMLTYIYKKDEKALELFKATTNYFLNHIPADYVAYWDLCFKEEDNQPRDTSSVAITLCGMLEGIKHMDKDDPLRKTYVNAANLMMNALIDNYLDSDNPLANGILTHQTYNKRANLAVEEYNAWGDYFFMEALHRMIDPDWKLYW